MENDDVRTEDLPDDLTPFITRTTLDHVRGGAFGDVWKCNYNHDANGISALVAVKAFRLPERYDLETLNRKISREIGILKILRHNNIVPLWGIATGFGRISELHCLVSPWMPNGTLNVYLVSNHNDLTILDRSRICWTSLLALDFCHAWRYNRGKYTDRQRRPCEVNRLWSFHHHTTPYRPVALGRDIHTSRRNPLCSTRTRSTRQCP